jgi:hypothetical protein
MDELIDSDWEAAAYFWDSLGLHGNAEQARRKKGFRATAQAMAHYRMSLMGDA